MDMSFADQALVAEWVWSTNLNSRRKKLSGEISNLWRETGVYNVPLEIDEKVAKLKLESMGIEIDILTEEQEKYLSSWKAGTA
jgi:adenosylhomocysteinase